MSLAERIALLLDSPLTLLLVTAVVIGLIGIGIYELLRWLDDRRWRRLIERRPYLSE